ncbi:excisionase family DNA binding protein [Nitrosomonas oligotropha]|uniref:Excisionase family DNA binding protein n=1 Tax=Nitrosomonas oligotropha TaxID=42354 RepID=A0A2T5HYS0_9PROT|nr:helix-turn-helix domain-containing protein [Nitrosomonas oligotropha]PTQ76741.1 excisionase family DNA binding protein [Nitrosomonas oligotropha]
MLNESLLTQEQAAEILGITPGTLSVWRCTKRYTIPYIKVGRLVRYRKSALDAFLELRTHGEEV